MDRLKSRCLNADGIRRWRMIRERNVKAKTRQLLRSIDDPRLPRRPSTMSMEREIQRVKSMQPDVENILGQPVDFHKAPESPSFCFADFTIAGERRDQNTNPRESRLYVPFSALGSVFTVHTNDQWQIDEDRRSEMIALICKRGFIYLPIKELEAPYDGDNHPLRGRYLWRQRLFAFEPGQASENVEPS